MATLEKIRKRSTLLLIVVGLALLAFIIGDFFTSGRTMFGNPTMIARVGDRKIDIQDFSRRYEEANRNMQQNPSMSKMDPSMLQAQVLNSMIQETLVNEELDKLGIEVTDDELSKAMIGANAHPYMYQFAQQVGARTPDEVYDLAFNPTKYNVPAESAQQLQQMWLQQEEQMAQMLKIQKFQSMLMGALKANELDAKAYYDANASTSRIAYVRKAYADMPDADFPVSSSEIRAEYDRTKEQFRIADEMRRGNYIAVQVIPSVDDKAEAQTLIDSTIVKLRDTDELNAVAGDSNFGVNRQSATRSQISSPVLKQFLDTVAPGAVQQISYINDEFTIAKLLGRKQAVDSVNVDIIAFEGDNAALDSLMAALASGKTADDVKAMTGVRDSRSGMWQSLAAAPESDAKTRILTAGNGYFIADSVAGSAQIVRVNERKAPVTVYDFATISYKVYPSDATIEKLNGDLTEFRAGIASADSLTVDKAMLAGYSLVPVTVTPDSYMLGNVPYSRNAVKWMMDAKPGDVSPILEDAQNDCLIMVALNDVIEPDYIPVTDQDITDMLAIRVRNAKKASKLIADYKGNASDLAGYSQLMESAIDSADVTFGQQFIPGIGGMESDLLGEVSVTPQGQLSDPVKGRAGVYVYQVVNVDSEGRPYDYNEQAIRFSQQLGAQAVLQNIMGIMTEENPIENRILRFYGE